MWRRFPLCAVLAIGAVAAAHAQAKHPDFSGTWQPDSARSRALTEKHGEVWRVAGGRSDGAGAPPPGATVMVVLHVISQNAAELVIERRYEDEILSRSVFKLDGSLSVNASRTESSRSTTVWKGNSLVTSGTTRIDFGGEMKNAKGESVPEIVREFVTMRTLMPDGSMEVVTRTKQDGKERVQYSVLVRVKS